MPVNRRRLLELATERLEAERKRIDEELAEIRAELKVEKTRSKTKTKSRKRKTPKLSAKERKAVSDRMKKYWAERKKKRSRRRRGSNLWIALRANRGCGSRWPFSIGISGRLGPEYAVYAQRRPGGRRCQDKRPDQNRSRSGGSDGPGQHRGGTQFRREGRTARLWQFPSPPAKPAPGTRSKDRRGSPGSCEESRLFQTGQGAQRPAELLTLSPWSDGGPGASDQYLEPGDWNYDR